MKKKNADFNYFRKMSENIICVITVAFKCVTSVEKGCVIACALPQWPKGGHHTATCPAGAQQDPRKCAWMA